MKKIYDLIIVGSGPAGLTAAIYASRYNLDFIVIGKLPGGEISEAHKIGNYPSQNNISGFELSQQMLNHAMELKAKILNEEILEVSRKDHFIVKTEENEYHSKKLIIASGRIKQKLNVTGEERFLGKGVSYCATCDGPFYKNKEVAVIGGGNSALTAALLLSEHAKKVHIIHRKDKFCRAEPIWIDHISKNKKINLIFNTEITEIIGRDFVEEIKLNNGALMKVDGVFIEIGSVPTTSIYQKLELELEKGYILADKNQKTNVQGVFAAGDITNNPLKQVITASSEGAVAAYSAYKELIKDGGSSK